MLTHSALTSILAGVSMYYAALLAMLATAIYDHLFIKSNISAINRLVVVSIHKVILTCLGGVFFGHGVHIIQANGHISK